MSTVINTNVSAIVAQRNIAATGAKFGRSVERLSSGLRINRAADDAAGLAISEKLRSQVKGYNQALRNVQDGISLVQTGEGALSEIHAMLQRLRELAVQAANGTMTLEDRNAVGREAEALTDEIDRIATTTKFNGVSLLDGTGGTVSVLAGVDAGITINLVTDDVQVANIDTASAIDDFQDFASYIDANDAQTKASTAIAAIDTAIVSLSATRSKFGAVQNRLEHTSTSLAVAAENMAASESRIRDIDIAAEMVEMTKASILQQAGVAVLAQANQAPTAILQLLR